METNNTIQIEKVKDYADDIFTALNRLTPQLNPDAMTFTEEEVRSLVAQPCIRLFVARDTSSHEIVGMISLILYRIPYGKKARAEDLVVDEQYRGRGIAKKLMGALIQEARDERVLYIDLSSKPSRGNANQLYTEIGFYMRETNSYRMLIEKKHES